ncbi:MAG: hypothetical protein GXP36_10615 [Actinobacteria bacterium]|nr:hypothetical protein [Actinomycetota bacterium]
MDIGKQQRVIVVTPLEATDEDEHFDDGEATTLLGQSVDDVTAPVEAPAPTYRAHLRSGSTSRPHNC